MRRDDRLRGLAQLAVIVGGPRIRCSGVPDHVLSALPLGASQVGDSSTTSAVDSALLVADSADDARVLLEALPNSVVATWLLWRSGPEATIRRADAMDGFTAAARFGVVGDIDSPTHLVDLDRAEGRRWFADSVRPAWGPRGRVARQVGRLPRLAGWGFEGRALLLTRSPARRWPLAPDGGARTPAVIALGGGSTAGRSVSTFTDERGTPLRHVKVDPVTDGAASELLHESDALEVVGRLDALRGTVPRTLGREEGPGWQAFAQSHLPGVMLDRRWETRHRRSWDDDVGDVIAWLSRSATASAEVAVTAMPSVPGLSGALEGLPPDLRDAVERGDRLAAAAPRLVHGDLWPANVVRGPQGIGVLDWESATRGHPLTDALSFVATATRHRLQNSETLADACRVALCGPRAPQTERWVRQVLASVGMSDLPRSRADDLVASQLLQVAVQPSPGGEADGKRRRDWTDCLLTFWRGCGRTDGQGPSSVRAR